LHGIGTRFNVAWAMNVCIFTLTRVYSFGQKLFLSKMSVNICQQGVLGKFIYSKNN